MIEDHCDDPILLTARRVLSRKTDFAVPYSRRVLAQAVVERTEALNRALTALDTIDDCCDSLAFTLRHMIEMGPHYNQAAVDAIGRMRLALDYAAGGKKE